MFNVCNILTEWPKLLTYVVWCKYVSVFSIENWIEISMKNCKRKWMKLVLSNIRKRENQKTSLRFIEVITNWTFEKNWMLCDWHKHLSLNNHCIVVKQIKRLKQ